MSPSQHEPERAAGAVCWRVDASGQLWLLMVHRPRYDDWSWPKGKVDPGEELPQTAVREVAEETGLQIRLGRPLPRVEYRLPSGQPKHVAMWAAHVPHRELPDPPRPREVDEARWVRAEDARAQLTRPADATLVDVVRTAFAAGELATDPLVIVRHGHAYPRKSWDRSDKARPLVQAGTRQAKHLRQLLGAWAPDYVVSSPAKRCVQTVRPFVRDRDGMLTTKKRLLEKQVNAHPHKAADLMHTLITTPGASLVCVHRPTIPVLFSAVAEHCAEAPRKELPRENPYLEPGELIVCQRRLDTHEIVTCERYLANARQ